MRAELNISMVESWLHGLLKDRVSMNVFAGSLPSTLKDTWHDMVMIDVVSVTPRSETGRNFGEASVNVFVYVKPNSSGKKNVAEFERLENALNEVLSSSDDGHRSITEVYSQSGFDTQVNYHYIAKILNIQIS